MKKFNSVPFILLTGFFSTSSLAENNLEEVVVVGSKTETLLRSVGSSVSVIEHDELELNGYASLADNLRQQAGVDVTNSGGIGKLTAVRIRGEESYRTLVILDGIELKDLSSTQQSGHIEHINNSSALERVEILRGPTGFAYGADAGGVLNIVTRQASEELEGHIAVELGSYNTNAINGFVGTGGDNYSMSLSASKHDTNGFNSTFSDLSGEKDGYKNTTLHSKLVWQVEDATELSLVLHDVDANVEFDTCNSFTRDCLSGFQQTNAKLQLKHNAPLGSHTVGITKSDFDSRYYRDNQLFVSNKGIVTKFDYLGSYDINPNVILVTGVDHAKHDVDAIGEQDLERKQTGAFVETRIQYNNQFYFNVGVRKDSMQDIDDETSARLSLAYVQNLNDDSVLKYRSSWGSGFRAPSLQEIAFNQSSLFAANTTLHPEKSQGYDIGLDYYHSNGFELATSFFDQRIEDEIYFDLILFSGYLQSEGKSASKGIEVSARYPLSSFIELVATGTKYNTSDRNDEQRIQRADRVFNVGALFTLLNSDLKIRMNARYVGERYGLVTSVGRVKLDAYRLMDISANYTIIEGLEAFARIQNAGDNDYLEVYDVHTAGRSAYAGVRFSF